MKRGFIVVVAIFISLVTALSASARGRAASQQVHVWLTTPDQQNLLTPQHQLAWNRATTGGPLTINVDDSQRYQKIQGFGASLTDSSAWLIANRLSLGQRNQVMTSLFSPKAGIGVGVLRQPMGASDFSTIGNYSYDDMPSGQTDPTLAHFSIAHDQAYILPLLRQARQLNPQLWIMGTPWSPPGWMKTSGSMIGGTLTADAYGPLANYFVKYVQAYAAQGVPIDAVTPQNEPQYEPSGYPGMLFSANQEDAFVKNNLGPAFASARVGTKILIYDHNWNDQNGGPATYPQVILSDPAAAQYVTGTAFHCYNGAPYTMSDVHTAYPDKGIYQTECSGGSWQGDFGHSFQSQLQWYIMLGLRNWAQSAVLWNVALDEYNGPTNGGCMTCRGLVTINQHTGNVTYTSDYYALGQVSKFVPSGAYRIGSNTFGWGSIEDVAFQNPDGSHTLVAYNNATGPLTFTVNWNGQSFTYTLPAAAAATFTWQ
jgi:glucosylceramidase